MGHGRQTVETELILKEDVCVLIYGGFGRFMSDLRSCWLESLWEPKPARLTISGTDV